MVKSEPTNYSQSYRVNGNPYASACGIQDTGESDYEYERTASYRKGARINTILSDSGGPGDLDDLGYRLLKGGQSNGNKRTSGGLVRDGLVRESLVRGGPTRGSSGRECLEQERSASHAWYLGCGCRGNVPENCEASPGADSDGESAWTSAKIENSHTHTLPSYRLPI